MIAAAYQIIRAKLNRK